jgi:hypothetical protein
MLSVRRDRQSESMHICKAQYGAKPTIAVDEISKSVFKWCLFFPFMHVRQFLKKKVAA